MLETLKESVPVRESRSQEAGHLMIAVMVIIALVLTIAAGMIEASTGTAKTRAVVKTQSTQYYEVEDTLNATIAWMQFNSQYFATLFKRANFEANFTVGTPSFGDNEGEHFETPTLVKINGTNDSPMLSTDDFFGTDAFPATTHITSGAAFDPVSAFQSADLGAANARVVMVWARLTPDGYEPVFRVDVVTGNNPDRGVHSYSYLYSYLKASDGDVGFYGQDSVHVNNGAMGASHLYTHNSVTNTWSKGAERANCEVQSDSLMTIAGLIKGNVATLASDGIVVTGTVTGTKCDGPGCHSYSLPSTNPYSVWSVGQTVVNVNAKISNQVIEPGYYGLMEIGNNRRVTLNNPGKYYIREIDYKGSQSQIFFPTISGNNPDGTMKKYELVIDTVNNSHLNGNRMYHGTNAPHRIEILYNGSGLFKFNGTAGTNAIFTAPLADVDVQGTHEYYGAIRAKTFTVTGTGDIFYDETAATPPVLNDVHFSVRKASQRYR